MVIPIEYANKTRVQQLVDTRVVVRKLLRIIRSSNSPRESKMQTRAQPVQLFRHIAIRTVFSRKQISIRSKSKIEGVSSTLGINITAGAQCIQIIDENQIGSGSGDS